MGIPDLPRFTQIMVTMLHLEIISSKSSHFLSVNQIIIVKFMDITSCC